MSNVIQTPTCPEAAEAVADLEPAPRAPSALFSSFSRKMHRPSRHSVEWGLAASEPAGPQKSLKSFHFGGVSWLRFASHRVCRYCLPDWLLPVRAVASQLPALAAAQACTLLCEPCSAACQSLSEATGKLCNT